MNSLYVECFCKLLVARVQKELQLRTIVVHTAILTCMFPAARSPNNSSQKNNMTARKVAMKTTYRLCNNEAQHATIKHETKNVLSPSLKSQTLLQTHTTQSTLQI